MSAGNRITAILMAQAAQNGRLAPEECATIDLYDLLPDVCVQAQAWRYSFGCIVLSGLTEMQEAAVLHRLGGGALRYHETAHVQSVEPNETRLRALRDTLAHSVYLHWAQDAAAALLDQAEVLLRRMGNGALGRQTQNRRLLLARPLRLERHLTGFLSPIGRPGREREEVAQCMVQYDIAQRVRTVLDKLTSIHMILGTYGSMSASRAERRLILFEVALLAAFPLFFLADFLPASLLHWFYAIFSFR